MSFEQVLLLSVVGVVALLAIIYFLKNATHFLYFRSNLFKISIEKVDKMSGEEFEEYLKRLYSRHGYTTKLTKKSHDFGGDLIASKDGISFIVQAKRSSSSVGIAAVQQTIGARAFYKTNCAILISNNYFTLSAQKLAAKSEVTLVDRDALRAMMKPPN